MNTLDIDAGIVQAILDWADTDSETRFPNGAEDDYYLGLSQPYRTGNRPLTSARELLLIRGGNRKIFATLEPFVAAVSEPTPININTAPQPVLMSLAPDIDGAHAPAGDPMTRDIAVASAAVVDSIVHAIEKAGVTVAYAVPEIILLPDDDPDWSILLWDGIALVRTGKRAGFAIETVALDALLQIEPHKLPPAVCIYATRAESLKLDMPSEVRVRHVDVADRLAPLAAAGAHEDGVDFLRGRRCSGNAKRLRSVVAIAVLVLIALVVYAGIGLLELRHIESRLVAHRHEQLQTFSRAFPDVKRVVNIRVQADQEFARMRDARRDGLDFLDAIYLAGLHAPTDEDGVEFHRVSYRDGVLNIQVRGPSASAIESYRNVLIAEHLSAELIAAESERDHIMGRLRITKRHP